MIWNGVKLSGDYGKISLYVGWVREKEKDRWVLIDIKDRGNGMVGEDIEGILEGL